MGWAIAVHGGARDISRSLPHDRRQPCEEALRHCLQIGVEALESNSPPLDVVELVGFCVEGVAESIEVAGASSSIGKREICVIIGDE
ncbi:hypothetical protein HN51_036191 [Arachis hypogaea]|nr:Isoaspartyl peptidase/L-asparaginase [Arachis hypogaea]